jgi:O-acetyl-ADP-ribose deacetylase (regulator of RNase III)
MPSAPTLRLEIGDITHSAVDAIVNAANERMLGGGGVDGAIHRAAGPRLREACLAVPETRPGVRCPTGEARITPAFELPCRYVLHTVGPIYESTEPTAAAAALRSAYRACLSLAESHGIARIAFPAISCGVYGYPLDEAAEIAISTCMAHQASAVLEVRFVLFSEAVYGAWSRAYAKQTRS